MATGWLGGFIAYCVLLTLLLAYGIVFYQTLIVFIGAILLAGFGGMIGFAMGRSSRQVKQMRRMETPLRQSANEKTPETEYIVTQ